MNKKRTILQAQKNKANTLSDGVKDYFVSDMVLEEPRIQTVTGRLIQKAENK